MQPQPLHALSSLLDPAAIATLNALGVASLSDLATFPPCVQAELLVSLARNGDPATLDWAIAAYLEPGSAAATAEEMEALASHALISLDDGRLTTRPAYGPYGRCWRDC